MTEELKLLHDRVTSLEHLTLFSSDDHLRALLLDYSWEVFDKAFSLCFKCYRDVSNYHHLFNFAAFFVETVPLKEVFMILVEKLSAFRTKNAITTVSMRFIYFTMQQYFLRLVRENGNQQRVSQVYSQMLLAAVSAASELLQFYYKHKSRNQRDDDNDSTTDSDEDYSQDEEDIDTDVNGQHLNRKHSNRHQTGGAQYTDVQVLNELFQLFYSLISRTARNTYSNNTMIPVAQIKAYASLVESPLNDSSEKGELVAYLLQCTSACIAPLSSLRLRCSSVHEITNCLCLLQVDFTQILEYPQKIKTFLFASFSFQAQHYYHPVSKYLRNKKRKTADMRSTYGASPSMNQTLPEDEEGELWRVSMEERVDMGVLGSGLHDTSHMSESTGLERTVFDTNKMSSQQRKCVCQYARACFDSDTEFESNGSNKGDANTSDNSIASLSSSGLNSGDSGRGDLSLIPLKALTDANISNQYDLLEEWYSTYADPTAAEHRYYGWSQKATGGPAALIDFALDEHLAGELPYALVGCALVAHLVLYSIHYHNTVKNTTSTNPNHATRNSASTSSIYPPDVVLSPSQCALLYPIGVMHSRYMYQHFSAFVPSLLKLPLLAPWEGLSLFAMATTLLPATPASRVSFKHPASTQGQEENASVDSSTTKNGDTFIEGYVFMPCAAVEGVGLEGDNISSSARGPDHTQSPQIGKDAEELSQHQDKAFGINAVVSYIAARSQYGSKHTRTRSVNALGKLCSSSVDILTLVQGVITQLMRCPDLGLQKTAYFALERIFVYIEDRSLYLLLRKVLQECPYAHMSGLLVDCLRSQIQQISTNLVRSQITSPQVTAGSMGTVEVSTVMEGDVYNGMYAVYTRRLKGRYNSFVDGFPPEAYHSMDTDSSKGIVENEKYSFQPLKEHSTFEKIEKREDRVAAYSDDVRVLVYQGIGSTANTSVTTTTTTTATITSVEKDSASGSRYIPSPFWSFDILQSFVYDSLRLLTVSSSDNVMRNLDIAKAGISLLQLVLSKLVGLLEILDSALATREGREGGNSYDPETVRAAKLLLDDFLYSGRKTDKLTDYDASTSAAYMGLQTASLCSFLSPVLAEACTTIAALVERRVAKVPDQGDREILDLQVLLMNMEHLGKHELLSKN